MLCGKLFAAFSAVAVLHALLQMRVCGLRQRLNRDLGVYGFRAVAHRFQGVHITGVDEGAVSSERGLGVETLRKDVHAWRKNCQKTNFLPRPRSSRWTRHWLMP